MLIPQVAPLAPRPRPQPHALASKWSEASIESSTIASSDMAPKDKSQYSRTHRIKSWTIKKSKKGTMEAYDQALSAGHYAKKKIRDGGHKTKKRTREKVEQVKGHPVDKELLQRFAALDRTADPETLSFGEMLDANKTWLLPPKVKIRIRTRPLPVHFRSLDLPNFWSAMTDRKGTYIPETDSHFFPLEVGGPFEIPAARGQSQSWIKPLPDCFWSFRSSALEELRTTGRLSWRRRDRWGDPWEKSRWKDDVRPNFDPRTSKWDRSMMALDQ